MLILHRIDNNLMPAEADVSRINAHKVRSTLELMQLTRSQAILDLLEQSSQFERRIPVGNQGRLTLAKMWTGNVELLNFYSPGGALLSNL